MRARKIVVIMALREEGQGLFEKEGFAVTYCGIGKINASYAAARAILRQKPDLIVNFGTAGSSAFPTHSLVHCHEFVQRDMDLTALGFEAGHTPFDPIPARISMPKLPRILADLPVGVCGSGDRFETQKPRVSCDVIDMEAYALAKVCWAERIPFFSVKYITDGADDSAHKDWAQNLPRAAAGFLKCHRETLDVLANLSDSELAVSPANPIPLQE